MTNWTKRFVKTLDLLSREVQELGKYLVIVETIEQQSADWDDASSTTMDPISRASWRALLLGLAGLLSNDQESITVAYLIDLADNHPYGFNNLSPSEVKQLVLLVRNELHSIRDLEARLRSVRDRKLAHLDRKHINEPARMINRQIETSEIGTALEVVENIVDRFLRGCDMKTVDFGQLKRSYRGRLDNLLNSTLHQGDVE
jgi:hypothetical protein